MHEFLVANPHMNDFLALLNTIFCTLIFFYVLYDGLQNNNYHLTVCALCGQYFRLFCHHVTTLPVPREYLYSPYDWPQFFWVISDTAPETETEGFALFYSGH